MKASDYHDIGLYFKDSRESLKLSVNEAAQAMNMRMHYVEALESGNLTILPGKTYIRGYIKNYALYLGLEQAEVLEAYDSLTIATKQELYIPEPTVQENLPSRALMIIVLIAVVMTCAYYMLMVKDIHIASAQIADVPTDLMLKAEAATHPQNTEWMECLSGNINPCFYVKYANDALVTTDGKLGDLLHSISP
jgi:cytoskeletal protein RodZ